MISFKKLLSIILSVSFLLTSTLPLSVLAVDDYCYKNAKGGYAYVECAYDVIFKVARGEVNYADSKNLGQLGNEELVAFNFRGFDEMFEKKKMIPIDDILEEISSLKKEYKDLKNSSAIWTKENVLYMISGALIGAVTGLFRSKSSRTANPTNPNSIDQDVTLVPISHSSSRSVSPLEGNLQQVPTSHASGSVFSSLFYGFLGAILPIIGFKINNEIKMQNLDEQISANVNQMRKVDHENKCKSVFLNSLLNYLDRPEHINFDMVSYQISTDDCNFHWRTSSSDINYTKEELESFPQKIREMAKKIRENLAKTGWLLPSNYIKPQDNILSEENGVNCEKLGN